MAGGDGQGVYRRLLAADFYGEVVDSLSGESAAVLKSVLGTTGHSEFVIAQVRDAVKENSQQRNRLTLWGRRLLGEAITQAQHVLARHDELAELVMSGGAGLGISTSSSSGCKARMRSGWLSSGSAEGLAAAARYSHVASHIDCGTTESAD